MRFTAKMRLLLDTQILLWWLQGDLRLSKEARRVIANPDHDALYSIASLWEIGIKRSLGKLNAVPLAVAEFAEQESLELLPVKPKHCNEVAALELIHKDPFDRMIVAQSRSEKLTLLTSDSFLSRYGDSVWVV